MSLLEKDTHAHSKQLRRRNNFLTDKEGLTEGEEEKGKKER